MVPCTILTLLMIEPAFSKLEEDDGGHILWMKIGYAAVNLLNVGLAIYKCNTMGLLPTTPSDWLEFMPHPEVCAVVVSIDTHALTVQSSGCRVICSRSRLLRG